MKLSTESAIDIWYRALGEEIGIGFPTSKPEQVRAKLYETRRDLGDPRLDSIIIFAPAEGDVAHADGPYHVKDEVWLVKKDVELP